MRDCSVGKSSFQSGSNASSELRTSDFDQGVDLAGEQIDPGQQAERAVALIG